MTYACKQDVKKELQPTPSTKTIMSDTEELNRDDSLELNGKETLITGQTTIEEEKCIFDQATQTDEFLEGVKELENYSWDQETKTAEIILNDHWNLTIKRGGCDHFTFEAEFVYDRLLDFEENKDIVFEKVIWLANLLDDLDGEAISECVTQNNLSITIEDHKRHINFMNVKIYELYYMLFYTMDSSSHFRISYYLN